MSYPKPYDNVPFNPDEEITDEEADMEIDIPVTEQEKPKPAPVIASAAPVPQEEEDITPSVRKATLKALDIMKEMRGQ